MRALLLVLACILAPGLLLGEAGMRPANAQSGLAGWTEPVNLSHSGAASQPRILVASDGRQQVFWWDLFDGLTMAVFDGASWSPAQPARINSDTLAATPRMILDTSQRIHAFWVEADGMLMHSQVSFGSSEWSNPDGIFEATLAFDVKAAPDHGITLAIVRKMQSSQGPAGIYVSRWNDPRDGWHNPISVYPSIYFRLLAPDQAWVQVWDAGNGYLTLSWSDPRERKALFANSIDAGNTWSTAEALGNEADLPATPRTLALPDGSLIRMWQAGRERQCSLFQQSISPVAEGATPQWTEPKLVFQDLQSCPVNDRFWLTEASAVWLWGEGTNTLTASTWDVAGQQWGQPVALSLSFLDLVTQAQVNLGELQGVVVGTQLAVAGVDAGAGEVWATQGDLNQLALPSEAVSSWGSQTILSPAAGEWSIPAMAIDSAGHAYFIWSGAGPLGGEPGQLFYSAWVGGSLSRESVMVSGEPGTIARHPDLLAGADGYLHVVWSGGDKGALLYSHARPVEGGTADWSPPVELTDAGVISHPQIETDGQGQLYVLYTVPLNEGRGVYLVHSENGGESWSPPETVFDAGAAGWHQVDEPSLAVEAGGGLHAAWVQGALPGTWPNQGIYYSYSGDKGKSWSTPLAISGQGYGQPRLALAKGQVHLLFASQDGGIWHRWIGRENLETSLAAEGAGLGPAVQVPGWQDIALPFAAVTDGDAAAGTLHLVGADADLEQPMYSFWNGEQWSSLDAFSPLKQQQRGWGASAAVPREGGLLAVAWLGQAPVESEGGEGGEPLSSPVLYFITREIPTATFSNEPAPTATAAPTATPSPTPEPTVEPVATPDLNQAPLPETQPVSPVAISGGLAALVLLGAFFTRRFFSKR